MPVLLRRFLESVCIVAHPGAEYDRVVLSFVIGKNRTSPLKQHTVESLELQGAFYSVRLRQLITDHEIHNQTVTHWTILMTAALAVPVTQEGKLDLLTVDEWKHVNGSSISRS